jgi:hypothetical protein
VTTTEDVNWWVEPAWAQRYLRERANIPHRALLGPQASLKVGSAREAEIARRGGPSRSRATR